MSPSPSEDMHVRFICDSMLPIGVNGCLFLWRPVYGVSRLLAVFILSLAHFLLYENSVIYFSINHLRGYFLEQLYYLQWAIILQVADVLQLLLTAEQSFHQAILKWEVVKRVSHTSILTPTHPFHTVYCMHTYSHTNTQCAF